MSALKPSRNLREFRESLGSSHAAQIKPYLASAFANPTRPSSQTHAAIMPSTAIAAR
jgi:hypothetical protein